MILYAESSAVLSWLLGEPDGPGVLRRLRSAERVVSSVLTPLECMRGIARSRAVAGRDDAQCDEARTLLLHGSVLWFLCEADANVLHRAALPFPREPVSTLDAVHLATILALRERLGEIAVLTFRGRIRENLEALRVPLAD